MPTTTCKCNAHGLTYKMNVYIKFYKTNIYFKKLKYLFQKSYKKKYWLKISLNTYYTEKHLKNNFYIVLYEF